MLSPVRPPETATPSGQGDRILVADDNPESLRLLAAFLASVGYQVITAQDGEEAVRRCQEALPDAIVMDVEMPRLSGLEATHAIRRLHPDAWIPIIFLSAHAGEEFQTAGLQAGGQDYLTKPVNHAILHEKLKALGRLAAAQASSAHYAAQLEASLEEARADQELARHLMQHILQTPLGPEDGVRQWVQPAEHFSGDAVLTARGPGGELYILLADAAGRGLAAAISVMPVIEAFYRLAEKGFSVAGMVRELNRKIHRLMPRERFVAAIIAVVDRAERSLQIWNGGLPEACFVDDTGHTVRCWPSQHSPLGAEPDETLRPQPEVFAWTQPGQLVVYTDGLAKAQADGSRDDVGWIRPKLAAYPGPERFDALVRDARAVLADQDAGDDISLVVVDCPLEASPALLAKPAEPGAVPRAAPAAAWRFSLELEAAQLRVLDIVPLLMNLLVQLQLDERHRGTAFMVLSELVNNALDHGLLRLDSALKQEPDGFERYLSLRAQRLAALESGSIQLSIEHGAHRGRPCLEITVQDSGDGFAHDTLLQGLDAANTLPAGRGIALVKAIAGTLQFEGNGNRARALLPLDPLPSEPGAPASAV